MLRSKLCNGLFWNRGAVFRKTNGLLNSGYMLRGCRQHSTTILRSGLFKSPAFVGATLCGSVIIGYKTSNYLQQDKQLLSILENDTLIPDKHGDTFEMGLYIASQRDLTKGAQEERKKRRHYKLLAVIHDHVIDPMLTLLRFIQLSAIFIPLLLLYPMTFFGSRTHIDSSASGIATSGNDNTEKKGSLIWYHLVRLALEVAGPSFIKLGQWASSRTDIFSRGFCEEIGNLHSNARKHSINFTKQKICQSLGENPESFDSLFEEFNPNPIGIGAIAQVYVGKLSQTFLQTLKTKDDAASLESLRQNNNWCAIKVMHPNARNQIYRDLRIMKFFAAVINAIPTMEWLSLPAEVEQFAVLMNLQLDLRIECLNLMRFNENFNTKFYSKQVRFPKAFPGISNKDVLFEEYIHALPMESFLKYRNKIDDVELRQKISDPFINAFLKMLILDDFVHSDLHPGNVMINFVRLNKSGSRIVSDEMESYRVVHNLRNKIKDNGNPNEIVKDLIYTLQNYSPQIYFIDAGLVTELNEKNRVNFIDLFNALVRFDGYRAGELMIERSKTPDTAIDKELFALKVETLVKRVKRRTFTLGTVSIGDLLDCMLSMVRKHHVRLEGDFVSIVVAILLLEGIGRQLDPELDLFASSLPILRDFSRRKEASNLLRNASPGSLLKIWLSLEVRNLMNSSAKQIHDLLKSDQLCPNY